MGGPALLEKGRPSYLIQARRSCWERPAQWIPMLANGMGFQPTILPTGELA